SSRLFFIGGKDASEHRLRSEQGKQVRRRLNTTNSLGITLLGKIREPGAECSDLFERVRLAAPVEKVGRRGRQFVKSKIEGRSVRPQHHYAVRLAIRQRVQQDRIHDAENR